MSTTQGVCVSVIYAAYEMHRLTSNFSGRFLPMNSNRAINFEVVSDRVKANLENFERKGVYCEFGQINLLVVETDPTLTFLIMDGQVCIPSRKFS